MANILEEYLHLQKTKSGVDEALKEKGAEVAKKCREVVSRESTAKNIKLLAEILLEKLNAK